MEMVQSRKCGGLWYQWAKGLDSRHIFKVVPMAVDEGCVTKRRIENRVTKEAACFKDTEDGEVAFGGGTPGVQFGACQGVVGHLNLELRTEADAIPGTNSDPH